jgi:hypothetical protein
MGVVDDPDAGRLGDRISIPRHPLYKSLEHGRVNPNLLIEEAINGWRNGDELSSNNRGFLGPYEAIHPISGALKILGCEEGRGQTEERESEEEDEACRGAHLSKSVKDRHRMSYAECPMPA